MYVPAVCCVAEEDWWWRVWRDLRGFGSADEGECGSESGISSAAQTGAQDGGCGAEETAG